MTSIPPPTIRLDGLSKWYGLVLGLNEVTTTFEPGVSGLLGPNGAGKSTLMKLVCGMLRPSLGTVRVAGEDPFDNPKVMRRLGLCPEQDATYPGVSMLRVLTYLTRLQGFTKHEARERARRALEQTGLGPAMNRSAAGYSKGMRQRAKLAQAIAHDPDILVLDEPLNGLDPPGRRELGALIEGFGDEGRCVVVSSHILHEVQALAKRVLFLDTGRLLAEGSVAEIRADLPEFPLKVKIKTPKARVLARVLLESDAVSGLELQPDGLDVLTESPDLLFDEIARVATDEHIPIDALLPADEDLEAVFRYLTR